jgi:hypothetical protein
MSQTWYECKVKYRKTHETGEQKVTTESYLLDAISYTEAEARINEEMAAYTSEEFLITNIKVANLSEVHPFENSDRWFKSKVALIAFDENSGKERKTNTYLLVQANDVKEAYDHTIEAMKGTMGDYTIPVISESPIMDVFPYFSGDEGDLDQLEKFNALKASTPGSNALNEKLEALDTFENEEALAVGAFEGEDE